MSTKTKTIATSLWRQGLRKSDIARQLNVSRQYIQQILPSERSRRHAQTFAHTSLASTPIEEAPTYALNTTAAQIRDLIRSSPLTIPEIASRARISTSATRKFLNPNRPVGIKVMIALAHALNFLVSISLVPLHHD